MENIPTLDSDFNGTRRSIFFVQNSLQAEDILRQYFHGAEYVGFDTERDPFSQVVRVISIATKAVCLVIWLEHGFKAGKRLESLLTNKNVGKIGFDVEGDARYIHQTLYPLTMNGLLDLQCLIKFFTNYAEGTPRLEISAKAVAKQLFDLDLDKSQQRSDWKKQDLSGEQIHYAANDAFLCLDVRERLLHGEVVVYSVPKVELQEDQISNEELMLYLLQARSRNQLPVDRSKIETFLVNSFSKIAKARITKDEKLQIAKALLKRLITQGILSENLGVVTIVS